MVPRADAAAQISSDCPAAAASAAAEKENCPPSCSARAQDTLTADGDAAKQNPTLNSTQAGLAAAIGPGMCCAAAAGVGSGGVGRSVGGGPLVDVQMTDPAPETHPNPVENARPAAAWRAGEGAAGPDPSGAASSALQGSGSGLGLGWLDQGVLIGRVATVELRRSGRAQTLLLHMQVALPAFPHMHLVGCHMA